MRKTRKCAKNQNWQFMLQKYGLLHVNTCTEFEEIKISIIWKYRSFLIILKNMRKPLAPSAGGTA